MPVAKARKLNIPQEALESRGSGGGNYAAIDVPADYEVTCVDVNDHVKKGANKVTGWRATYEIDGYDVQMDIHMSFSEAARWKIVQVFEAHGFDLSEGVAELDPNALIGETVGARIDWDEDEKYREIKYVFDLADAEAADEAVEVVDPEELEEDDLEIL